MGLYSFDGSAYPLASTRQPRDGLHITSDDDGLEDVTNADGDVGCLQLGLVGSFVGRRHGVDRCGEGG